MTKPQAIRTIDRAIDRALTVEELIEILQGYEPQAKVLFTCDYGDHCHTTQALLVTNATELSLHRLADSAYSQSGIAVRDEKYCDEDEADGRQVIILS